MMSDGRSRLALASLDGPGYSVAAITKVRKSTLRVYDSHRAQLAVYFILIEEETGVRPPHGYIVTGQGTRHQVQNTPELRAWVMDVAERIRVARREFDWEIPVRQPAAKCRACGMREGCGQRAG
jgi:CRISPR-associated exonuclease Cas4